MKCVYKNRKDLANKNSGLNRVLRDAYPHLLDKYLPLRDTRFEIIEFIKTNKRRPIRSTSKTDEGRLSMSMGDFISVDADFKKEVDKLCPIVSKKDQIIIFIKKYNRRPKGRTGEEGSLANAMSKFVNMDLQFKNKINKLCPADDKKAKQNFLETEYFSQGVKPSRTLIAQHYAWFSNYTKKSSGSYDASWATKMVKKYPLLAEGLQERSFKKMLSMMPKGVNFINGQKYRGTNYKHKFVCAVDGEFAAQPSSLYKPWRMGLTGHPAAGRRYLTSLSSKKVYCFNNKITYDSASAAARKLKLSFGEVCAVARGARTETKGYRFKYV